MHRGPEARALDGGQWRGTVIGVPANAYTLFIYFTNENRSVKADFS